MKDTFLSFQLYMYLLTQFSLHSHHVVTGLDGGIFCRGDSYLYLSVLWYLALFLVCVFCAWQCLESFPSPFPSTLNL
jgi:hypothetical protein